MEPELYKEYVKDGTLRIEWRDFPYRGQESVNAAVAARAAQAQDEFWDYHDLLYDRMISVVFASSRLAVRRIVGLQARPTPQEVARGALGVRLLPWRYSCRI